MAKPSKRLIAILSLFVLLQQFSPALAFAADLARTRITHDQERRDYSEEDEDNADEEIQESSQKRNIKNKVLGTILRKGWKLLGKQSVIKKVKWTSKIMSSATDVLSIGLTVTRAIAGCEPFASDLTTNWNEFQSLVKKFHEISKEIDRINLQARTRQIYINASFYEYRRTRDKLEEIADEKERVFKSFGPEVLAAVENATFNIEQMVIEKNATGQRVGEKQIYKGYKKGIELTLDLLMPSLSLAFTGGKLLYKKYLKDTVIGKKLVEVKDKFGDAIKSGGSGKFSQKIMSSKIMNTKFGRGLQKIGRSLKNGLVKAATVFKRISKRITPFLELGGAAYQMWETISSIKECTDMANEAEKSVANMKKLVDETKEILTNVTEANAQIQTEFDKILGYAFGQAVIQAMTDLKTMMEDTRIVKQTDDGIIQSLQDYIVANNISSANDKNKQKINEIQREANAALHSIPFTLKCFTEKGKFITSVKDECTSGKGSLAQIYTDVKRLQGIANTDVNDCAAKTGRLVPTLKQIKKMWKEWVNTNQTINELCLMNNEAVVEGVIKQLQNGKTDPTIIAKEVQQTESVDEITAMIKILKNDPRVNSMPLGRQRSICAFKEEEMSFERANRFLNANKDERQVTKEEYDSQICPVPESDVD